MRNVRRLRAAGKCIVSGQASVCSVAKGKGAQRDGLGSAHVLVRYRAGAGKGEGLAADQCAQGEDAGRHVRHAVVDAAAGHADGVRVDGAGGVVGIADVVVAAAVAVVYRDPGGGYRLVAYAHVLVGEGKRAAAEHIAGKQRAAGDSRRTRRREAAVVSLRDARGAQRERRLRNVRRLRAAGKCIVSGQASVCSVAKGKGAQRDGLGSAHVLVRYRAGAGKGEGLAADQCAQGEDAGRHVRRAVVDAAAGHADGVGVDGQCAVSKNDVIALLVGVVAGRGDGVTAGIDCPLRGAAVADRTHIFGRVARTTGTGLAVAATVGGTVVCF